MKRLIAISISALVAAGPVSAGTLQDSIVTQLRQQGFTQIEINRTWLGRYRITAKRRALRREIVINPATGTILRDYWTETPDEGAHGLVDPDDGYSGDTHGDDTGDEGDNGGDEGHDSGEGDDGGDSGEGDDGGDSGEGDDGGGGNSGSGGGDSDGGEGDD